jgi:pimeloyl-ACP methyl ester carboxylesterase
MATYETAENKFLTIKGVKHAYRLFGQTHGVPLFLHPHFRGNMDYWDPAFINPLAAKRPILLVDSTGVGRSEGEVPTQYSAWAQVIIDVVQALGITKVDILGFSMGGFVVQLIALQAPDLVRKLIVAGAGPSGGEGVLASDPEYFTQVASATTEEEWRKAFKWTFFSHSDKKQEVGEQWWQRMTKARKDRAPLLGPEGVQNQIASVQRFFSEEHRDEGSYDRLDQIKIPVLVANGSNDLLVATENSYVLWKRLVNADAHLHLYPDSGHGFLDEYHEHFSNLVNGFLDE